MVCVADRSSDCTRTHWRQDTIVVSFLLPVPSSRGRMSRSRNQWRHENRVGITFLRYSTAFFAVSSPSPRPNYRRTKNVTSINLSLPKISSISTFNVCPRLFPRRILRTRSTFYIVGFAKKIHLQKAQSGIDRGVGYMFLGRLMTMTQDDFLQTKNQLT